MGIQLRLMWMWIWLWILGREHGVNFKNVVLCSGDGDYLPLVEQLQGLGIKVIVLASPGHTNHFLQRQADEYISLIDIMGEVSDR